MLTFFRRIEDLLVQVVRLVLLAFALVVLLGLSLWIWESVRGSKPTSTEQTEPAALNWKGAKLDLAFVVEETGRDLRNSGSELPLTQRLSDPQLRPSFQQADQIIRTFVNQNPAQRERVESEGGGRGLAPLNVLLEGKDMPDAALVQRMLKDEQENGRAAYVPSDDRDDSDDDENNFFLDPLEVAYTIHERAQMAEAEHGAGAYIAYVQGLPAALQQVLGNDDLAPKLQQRIAADLVNMVLTNYTISFDRTARTLRGDSSDDDDSTSLLNLYSKAAETAFWSMLMSFLVLVVMVVVFIRMERHLRVISERPQRAE